MNAGLLVEAESTGRHLYLFHDARGYWESSGGRPKPGERAVVTAYREFREESGYEGTVHIYTKPRCTATFCLFLGRVPTQFRPVLSREHSDYRWAYLGEAPRPLHPELAKLIRRFDHALRC